MFKILGEQVHLCMKTFKKIIVSITSLICIIIVLSSIITMPIFGMHIGYYSDGEFRKKTAGSYDTIFIGDSDGMAAFNPKIFDEITGNCSYNLSETSMNPGSEYFLLEKEIERNPVKTVVLQFSYSSFTRNLSRERGDCDSITVQRLDSFGEILKYMTKYVKVDDWLNVYSRLLVTGFSDYLSIVGGNVTKFNESTKGCHFFKANDLSLTSDEAKKLYNQYTISTNFEYDYADGLSSVIEMCKKHEVNIICVILPLSNNHIWEYDNWDEFSVWIKEFCEKNNTTLYDFNLYKEKYLTFSDSVSYKDHVHMSKEGADSFTTAFSNIYNDIYNNIDVSQKFYSNYAEMKADSPYNKYLDN